MKMKIAKSYSFGKFLFVRNNEKHNVFDIYFLSDGENIEMEYVATVKDYKLAKNLCKLFAELHNKSIEEDELPF